MLLAFQILLFVLIMFFGLGLFAESGQVTYEDKNRYLSIVLASVIAMTITFFVNKCNGL